MREPFDKLRAALGVGRGLNALNKKWYIRINIIIFEYIIFIIFN